MAAPDDALLQIAADIADGAPLDWLALQADGNPSDPAAVAALQTIAAIAHAHDTLTTTAGVPPAAVVVLEPGSTWHGLQIIDHVGAGRFGDVYRAFDPSLDREVALKILRSAEGTAADGVAVVEEGRLAARVRHPNVVTVYGAGRADGLTGVWMELIRGRTLETELAEHGPVDAGTLTRIAQDLSAALGAVHAAGLVHRDVKTTNVMRDETGRIVLGDFGTGRLHGTNDEDRTGLAGTPQYLAPEIFEGAPATPQSDIYSLGVLLYRLATSTFPVAGRSLLDLRAAHAAGEPSALRSLRPDLPNRLIRAIDRALAPTRAGRFATAPDFHGAIRPPARPVPIAVAAGIALVGLTALLTHFLGPGRTTDPSAARASTGLVVEEIAPDLQTGHVIRGPAVTGAIFPCAPRANQAVGLCNLATGSIEILREPATRNLMGTDSVWPSPDGSKLAYVWADTTLSLMNTDGSGAQELHRGLEVFVLGWSADGNALIFDEAVGTGDDRRLMRLPLAPIGAPAVLWEYGGSLYIRPDLSPDGSTVVAAREPRPGEPELVGVDIGTNRVLWVHRSPGRAMWPKWTPDGRSIVFLSQGATYELRRLNLVDGSPAEEITVRDLGRMFAIQAVGFGANGDYCLTIVPPIRSSWVASLDGATAGQKRPIPTLLPQDTMGADWSPDGTRVAYLTGPFGSVRTPGTLMISDVSGRRHETITLPGFVFRVGPTVRWSPDGRWLAVIHGGAGGGEVLSVVDPEHPNSVHELFRAGPNEVIRWPAWSQDSSSVLFVHGVRQTRNSRPRWTIGLRRLRVADRFLADVLTLNASAPGHLGYPHDVAGDGSIASAVRQSPGCVVRIMPPGSSEPLRRHQFDGECTALAWAPDNTTVVVAVQTGQAVNRDWTLWAINDEGGTPARVPLETSRTWNLSISPDGSELLFTDGDKPRSMWRVSGLGAIRRP